MMDELEEMERLFEEYRNEFDKDQSAMGLVSMAHDWYGIHCDEEGDRLLHKAERLCPGYFKSTIHKHIKNNLDFAQLVMNLHSLSGYDLMKTFGYVKTL